MYEFKPSILTGREVAAIRRMAQLSLMPRTGKQPSFARTARRKVTGKCNVGKIPVALNSEWKEKPLVTRRNSTKAVQSQAIRWSWRLRKQSNHISRIAVMTACFPVPMLARFRMTISCWTVVHCIISDNLDIFQSIRALEEPRQITLGDNSVA
jgi:hypothetical protein